MATVGQQLLAPETGWIRYDNTNPLFKFSTTPTSVNDATSYNGSLYNSSGDITFSFEGVGIRFIGYSNAASYRLSSVDIIIDGVKETFSQVGQVIPQRLDYQKENLTNKIHTVTITSNGNSTGGWGIAFDAIDLMLTPKPRLVLKNSSTNQHYSLADKTLILLPDASDETMIKYGIEAGKEIKLDEAFDKIQGSSKDFTIINNNKLFTIPLTNNRIKKIKIKDNY